MRSLLVNQGRETYFAVACLLVLMMAGGGGDAAPGLAGGVQALVAFMAAVRLVTVSRSGIALPWTVIAVACLALALPLLQLIPLPPSVWHALPGRQLTQQVLALAAADQSWRPLSLFPFETLAVLMTLVPALVMLMFASSVRTSGQTLLLIALVLVAFLGLVVGAVQVSGADSNMLRFYNPSSPILSGFQSNRSGQADVFLIAIVCIGGITRELYPKAAIAGRRWHFLLLNATGGLLLSLAVVLTRSRFGMVMVPVALILQLAFLRPALGMSKRIFGLLVGAVAAVGAGAIAALSGIPKVSEALTRFMTTTELRPEIWKDTLYLIDKYAPWGTGMGTFEPVFQLDERLDWLGFRVVNRAHCDFLELYLEGGIPAAVILTVITALVAFAAWRALRQKAGPGRWQIMCAIWGLFLIGAHSLFDYPLRSMSLEAIFAVLVAIILCSARRPNIRPELKVQV